jgi:hypothetical protein
MIEAEPTYGLDQAMNVNVMTAHAKRASGKGTFTDGRDWEASGGRQAARRS